MGKSSHLDAVLDGVLCAVLAVVGRCSSHDKELLRQSGELEMKKGSFKLGK